MHRVLKTAWILAGICSLWLSASHARPAQAGVALVAATHAPLVYAPAISVLPGPLAGGTFLGAMLFSSFGSTSAGENAITGTLWHDQNENQSIDETELLLSNVTVALSGALAGGSILTSTTTNAAGEYTFAGLPDGEYTITVVSNTLTAGLTTPTYDKDGTDTPHAARLIACCSELPAVNFGYRGANNINGFVWEDMNGNGSIDAGEPAQNAALTLQGDLNGDGVIDTLNATANAGAYTFANLVPGLYTITVDAASWPAGMQPIDGQFSRRITVTGMQENIAGVDFGFVRPASIQGRVWLDANRNGAQDAGERGLSGIVITLFKAANEQDAFTAQSIGASLLAITTSNAGGEYRFDGITPGRPYTLHFALPAGFAWTRTSDESAVDENGDTGIIRLTSSENVIFKANAGATKPTHMTINKVAQPPTVQLGGRITYTIMISNTGETMAHNFVISDSLPAELRFISAIPWPSLPAPEEGKLIWAVGDLEPRQAFTVTLMTQIRPDAILGSNVSNTAFLLADMQTVVESNDLKSEAITFLQPTAITLASFDAEMEGAGVQLSWRTLLAQNTFGFNVLRSATGNRADAMRVNTELIPAVSAGSYALLDVGGNVNHLYWLQEMELNGATSEHGPFSVKAPATAALPAQIDSITQSDGLASPMNALPGGVPIVQMPLAPASIQPQTNMHSEQPAPVAMTMHSPDIEPATRIKQDMEMPATTSAGRAASAQQPVATQVAPAHAKPTAALPPETNQKTIADAGGANGSANSVRVLRGNSSPPSVAMDDSPQMNESFMPFAVLPIGLAMGCVLMVVAGVIRRKR